MDYKEKYKEALERAREQYNKRTPLYDIESIFPELKESKDERIRREIIEYITLYKDSLCDKEYNSWITWLEKQGKKLDADKVIEWLNDQACLGWIEDIEVEKFVEQFKKDFEL